MLELDGICFSFGDREVLADISCRLRSGHLVALLGNNGSGKSTLLRTINNLLRPHRGVVLLDGDPTAGLTGREIARKMGYMPQKTHEVACTVFDAVLLGRRPYFGWNASPEDLRKVETVLARLGMAGLALRDTSGLSGGEMQKVVMARALVQEPRVLLLDEPINHLDVRNQMETMSLLRKITREMDLLVVVVLHDLGAALRFADRFILLKGGRLHACGGRDVLTGGTIREVFGIEAVVRDVDGVPVVLPLAPCPAP